MTRVSTFTHEGQDIEVLLDKGKISYIFELEGKRYGNAVKVEGKSHLNYVNACFALILNYMETHAAALTNHDSH